MNGFEKKFELETGKHAKHSKSGACFHTLSYVKWLENKALAEENKLPLFSTYKKQLSKTLRIHDDEVLKTWFMAGASTMHSILKGF